MSGQGRNEIRILDELVNVADEGTAGHVGAGDFIDRNLLLLACDAVQHSDKVCDSGEFKDYFDVVVVSLRAFEWEEAVSGMVLVPRDDVLGDGIQRNDHGADIFVYGLWRC